MTMFVTPSHIPVPNYVTFLRKSSLYPRLLLLSVREVDESVIEEGSNPCEV